MSWYWYSRCSTRHKRLKCICAVRRKEVKKNRVPEICKSKGLKSPFTKWLLLQIMLILVSHAEDAILRLLQISPKFLARLWSSFFMFLVLIPNIYIELPGNFGFPDCKLYFSRAHEFLLFMYSADSVWTVMAERVVLVSYSENYSNISLVCKRRFSVLSCELIRLAPNSPVTVVDNRSLIKQAIRYFIPVDCMHVSLFHLLNL
jgi:hypothetical protein